MRLKFLGCAGPYPYVDCLIATITVIAISTISTICIFIHSITITVAAVVFIKLDCFARWHIAISSKFGLVFRVRLSALQLGSRIENQR